ncbi:MAG: hypothetical protein IKZ64_03100, partial [Alphaproteobacteria bacterium]|nr:hypothetical protein [Alphaproteobacteria bacterium]
MNQNQTLQTLEDIIHLIRTLDNANDADDSMDIKMRLKNLINDAYKDRIISDDMYNAYDELFQTELRTGFLNVEALYNITVKNYENVNGVVPYQGESLAPSTFYAKHNEHAKIIEQYYITPKVAAF